MSIVISGNKNLKFIKSVYYQPVQPIPDKYLCIEALEDDFYIAYTDCFYEMGYTEEGIQSVCNETGWEYEKMQYSLDKRNWFELEPYEPTPSINTGEKIYLKRRFITPGLFEMMYMPLTNIFCDYQYNLSGNCNSILFGDSGGDLFDGCFYELFAHNSGLVNISKSFLPATTLAEYCYQYMFSSCTSLTQAPELPATTLAEYCYSYMFEGCTSLTQAPELPATKLAEYCYNEMFYGCTSLVTAPSILPATTLVDSCYSYMFEGCTSLVTSPELPATTLANYCYDSMFNGCTSLVSAPELPATTLTDSCYNGMFLGCGSLVSVPSILPATTLTDSCYQYMFKNCSSLVTAPALPATTLAGGCYSYMFQGCTSLVTSPELPATTLANYCYSYMFNGCTSLTQAPELPATTLAKGCYSYMFYNCRKLNYIKALFTTTPSSSYTSDWVQGVSSTGTFIKNANATWDVTGTSGIPTGWAVQTV
jgi:hypothetical protein